MNFVSQNFDETNRRGLVCEYDHRKNKTAKNPPLIYCNQRNCEVRLATVDVYYKRSLTNYVLNCDVSS